MFIWSFTWLSLRLEFCINLGLGQDVMIHILPCLPITISPKEGQYRYVSVTCAWLILQTSLSYHKPYGFRYDEKGALVGRNYYPQYRVDIIDARN